MPSFHMDSRLRGNDGEGGTNGLCLVRGFVVAAGRRRSVYLPRNYYSSSPRKRGPIRPSLAQLWIPACAHYCPEYFLMIGCKLLLALVACVMTALTIQFSSPRRRPGSSAFPQTKARKPSHWIPAFVGMTRRLGSKLALGLDYSGQ